MWFNKGDQNSLESGLKSPKGHELCRRLHPNDSRNPFSFTVVPQGVMGYYENLSRVKNGAKKHPLHNPLLKTYENYVAV